LLATLAAEATLHCLVVKASCLNRNKDDVPLVGIIKQMLFDFFHTSLKQNHFEGMLEGKGGIIVKMR
jgi:hypothetical protein